jgi:phosphate transport system protein
MVGEHSSKQYDQELEAIRSKVLLMGGMVETQFDEALNCFRVGNTEQADKVMADDHAVNQLEVQLDDDCSHLIVRRQPAANDLRTVMATIKVITDLERIGDEATKIARTAKSLHERGMVSFNHYETVRTISRATADMLHDALDAQHHHVHDGRPAHDLVGAGRAVGGEGHRAHRRPCEEHRGIRDLRRRGTRYPA